MAGASAWRTPAPARIPGTIEPADLPAHLLAANTAREGLAYAAADMFDTDTAEYVELCGCTVTRCSWSAMRLDHLTVTDCVLDTCDLSNAQLMDSSLSRVELTGCRITGMTVANSAVRDLVVSDCRGRQSSFRFSRLRNVRFAGCVLSGADFTQCRFDDVVFDDCELDGAQFSGAKVARARFRNCVLTGVGGVTGLAGATISEADLASLSGTLAAALGIAVEKG